MRYRSVSTSYILLLRYLACGFLSGTATAFGTSGHRVVADLAWYQLSQESKDWIYHLIKEDRFWYGIEMTTVCSDAEHCKPLGAIAEWADDVKKSVGVSHAIAIPDEGHDCLAEGAQDIDPNCRLDYDRDCVDDDCLVGQIVKFTTVLQDWMSGRRRRKLQTPLNLLGFLPGLLDLFANLWGTLFGDSLDAALDGFTSDEEHEALMFITHLVGDLHQPLHCGQGSDHVATAIDVTYMGYHSENFFQTLLCAILPSFLQGIASCGDVSLHSAWDFSILIKYTGEEFNGDREALEDSIWYEYLVDNEVQTASWLSCLPDAKTTPYLLRQTIQDCVMEWANESLEVALKYGYKNTDGSYIDTGTDLTEEYHQLVVPVVRKQLAKGSVRLAALLEHVLNPYREAPSAVPTTVYAPSVAPSRAMSEAPTEASID